MIIHYISLWSLTITSCVTVNGLDYCWCFPSLCLLGVWHNPRWKPWLGESQETAVNEAGRKSAAGGPICRQRPCGGNIHRLYSSVCCSTGASLNCAPAAHSVWMSWMCRLPTGSLTQAVACVCFIQFLLRQMCTFTLAKIAFDPSSTMLVFLGVISLILWVAWKVVHISS